MTDTHADAHGHAHAVPKHPYHLVDPSPWPIVGAIAAGLLTTGLVLYRHNLAFWYVVRPLGIVGVVSPLGLWFRDVINEATFQCFHTPVVQIGMRYGMALFIASEVMFFSAF